MEIKFADNTALQAVNAEARRETLEGASRDVLALEFEASAGFDALKSLGQAPEKLETLTVGGYPYSGYTIFGGLALEPTGRLRLRLGQKISARETDLMAQNAALQSTVDTLVLDSLGGAA